MLIPQSVPGEMLTEIAFGIEPPDTIAYRYGYEASDFEVLKTQDWFVRDLEMRKADLAATGWTFRKRMALMAEDLLCDVYQQAKTSGNPNLKLEAAKYLSKLADLEPKPLQPTLVGTGFSININMGEPKHASHANRRSPRDEELIEVETDLLPSPPAYLSKIPFRTLSMLPPYPVPPPQ